MTNQFPPRLIETVNKLIRTSRQMMSEIGREPTTEELAERPFIFRARFVLVPR
jgi:RNA polymerase primary sigma factor